MEGGPGPADTAAPTGTLHPHQACHQPCDLTCRGATAHHTHHCGAGRADHAPKHAQATAGLGHCKPWPAP
ncbi:hypothetical protein HaLaN_21963, partial [Haematococcus lacustris]